jgi:transcriptional regulator with XRE-family HTH domain
MSGSKLTIQQKKEWAKTLYTKEGMTVYKELAARVGASALTISKWVNEGQWEKLRVNMLLTRQEQLVLMINELEELNNYIKKKPAGERFADSKQGDTRRKLIRDIKDLETKASVAEMIETARRFTGWVKIHDYAKAQEFVTLFDAFIKDNLG